MASSYLTSYIQTRPTRPPTSAPIKLLGVTHLLGQSSRSPLIYSHQNNGIPQGSHSSGILFLIAINDMFSAIPYPITPILFVDDLSFHLKSNNQEWVHRILQDAINSISSWLSKFGFRKSPINSSVLIFQNRQPRSPVPVSPSKQYPNTHLQQCYSPRTMISSEPLLATAHQRN